MNADVFYKIFLFLKSPLADVIFKKSTFLAQIFINNSSVILKTLTRRCTFIIHLHSVSLHPLRHAASRTRGSCIPTGPTEMPHRNGLGEKMVCKCASVYVSMSVPSSPSPSVLCMQYVCELIHLTGSLQENSQP